MAFLVASLLSSDTALPIAPPPKYPAKAPTPAPIPAPTAVPKPGIIEPSAAPIAAPVKAPPPAPTAFPTPSLRSFLASIRLPAISSCFLLSSCTFASSLAASDVFPRPLASSAFIFASCNSRVTCASSFSAFLSFSRPSQNALIPLTTAAMATITPAIAATGPATAFTAVSPLFNRSVTLLKPPLSNPATLPVFPAALPAISAAFAAELPDFVKMFDSFGNILPNASFKLFAVMPAMTSSNPFFTVSCNVPCPAIPHILLTRPVDISPMADVTLPFIRSSHGTPYPLFASSLPASTM